MLELLRPKAGDRIIDIGYGSGWQTALLADIVSTHGTVYAIERVPNLCALGKRNVANYPEHAKRVEFFCQDATPGLPDIAQHIGEFDGIIAAADVRTVPQSWREQLTIGGRLVYPSEGVIYAELKRAKDTFEKTGHPGFIFVPFVSNRQSP
jgi:protein-L-isoaspartate(D-aspartate) O-methyltransferase